MTKSILPVLPATQTIRSETVFSLHCDRFHLLGSSRASRARAEDKAAESPHAAGWVVIPVEEYRVLRAKAYPVDHDPEPPPLDATLTRVDYDLHVAGDLAAGRASLTVDVLKDGWVRVPVPAGLLVREARLDGKLVSLVPGDKGKAGPHLSAMLSHAGRFELLLDIDVPVSSNAGDETISLPSTESGVTRAAVLLPQQGVDLRISGGLLSDKSEAAGETKWLAYARGNEALTFTWRKKTEDHHIELPLRLRGSLTQLTSLAEDSTSIYAEANFEVVQGAAREVRIQLPQKITINQVSGAMVADWEMKNGELPSPSSNRSSTARASSSTARPVCPRMASSTFPSCASRTRSATPAASL